MKRCLLLSGGLDSAVCGEAMTRCEREEPGCDCERCYPDIPFAVTNDPRFLALLELGMKGRQAFTEYDKKTRRRRMAKFTTRCLGCGTEKTHDALNTKKDYHGDGKTPRLPACPCGAGPDLMRWDWAVSEKTARRRRADPNQLQIALDN